MQARSDRTVTVRIEHAILGEALRCLRIEAGLSKYALEKRIGKHKSYIARIENGERFVDFPTLVDIVRATGANFGEFMMLIEGRLMEHYRTHGDPIKSSDMKK